MTCDMCLPTLKRTITKSTLHVIEGTAYLCALRQRIVPGARATSTVSVSQNAMDGKDWKYYYVNRQSCFSWLIDT